MLYYSWGLVGIRIEGRKGEGERLEKRFAGVHLGPCQFQKDVMLKNNLKEKMGGKLREKVLDKF